MDKMKKSLLLVLALLTLTACGKKEEEKKTGPAGTPVSITQAATRNVELTEESVGSLDSPADPVIAAEVPGKVLTFKVKDGQEVKAGQVLAELDARDVTLALQAAQADVRRLEAVSANDAKRLSRLQQLREQNFISPAGLEDAATQATGSKSQLEAARAQLALAERNLSKTRIIAPFDGRADHQLAVQGQFVKVGDPVYKVIYTQKLRARLSFPERLSGRIQPGMTVHVASPGQDGALTGKIEEVRPSAGTGNRSFDALASFDNPGWPPGATLRGAVVIGQHANAVVVPEVSVVLRPAGKVVYVLAEGKALQRVVQTGAKQADGMIEISAGLQTGETVIVDGAGFLTDQAPVAVAHQEAPPASAPAATK